MIHIRYNFNQLFAKLAIETLNYDILSRKIKKPFSSRYNPLVSWLAFMKQSPSPTAMLENNFTLRFSSVQAKTIQKL